jgi:SAM-dependent methyltransferase
MDKQTEVRERTKQLAEEFLNRGDATGWFDALYVEAAGNHENIPWADLEPNKFLVEFAEKTDLKGNGRKALVVGCGLGDDAKYLHQLGFIVTGFDISPTAIEWARRLNPEIHFEVADLFNPPRGWLNAFEFVLEVYTIQPLPLEIRPQVIEAIANFVAPNGRIVIVTRGREDDEIPPELPWALSRKDLSQFEKNSLTETYFEEMWGDEEEPVRRFVIEYSRLKS